MFNLKETNYIIFFACVLHDPRIVFDFDTVRYRTIDGATTT